MNKYNITKIEDSLEISSRLLDVAGRAEFVCYNSLIKIGMLNYAMEKILSNGVLTDDVIIDAFRHYKECRYAIHKSEGCGCEQ